MKELYFLSYDLNNYQVITKHVVLYAFGQLDNQIPEATLEKVLLTSPESLRVANVRSGSKLKKNISIRDNIIGIYTQKYKNLNKIPIK